MLPNCLDRDICGTGHGESRSVAAQFALAPPTCCRTDRAGPRCAIYAKSSERMGSLRSRLPVAA
jgi:hypothetical protein